MLLLFLSCAHLDDPERLAEQANMLARDWNGRPFLSGTWTAELDGAPPSELLIEAVHPSATKFVQEHFQAFQRHEALGPPIILDRFTGPSQVRVLDIEQDGRDELLLLGDITGFSYADLTVWSWDGERWRDRIWGFPPGISVEVADINGDGVLELIGVGPSMVPFDFTVPTGAEIEVLCPGQGGLLRPCPAPEPKTWLVPLMEALANTPNPPSAYVRVPLLVDAAEEYGLRPGDAEALQTALEQRIFETGDGLTLRGWLQMMTWARSPRALPFILELAQNMDKRQPYIARCLCALGAQDEALSMVRRELLSPLMEPESISEFFYEILDACPEGKDWLPALILDPSLPLQARVTLVHRGLPHDPDGAALALSLLSDPELGLGAARALVFATDPYARPRWAPAPAEVGALMPTLQADLLPYVFRLLRHLDGALPVLESARKLPLNDEARLSLWQALADLGSKVIDPVQILNQTQDFMLRRSLHMTLANSGEPAQVLAGLTIARGNAELAHYANGLGTHPSAHEGPEWAPVERLVQALMASKDPETRRLGTVMLGHFPTATAQASLEKHLQSGLTQAERVEAAKGLARFEGAEPLLLARLTVLADRPMAQFERDQLWAALGSMQTAQALNALAQALKEDPLAWAPAQQLATARGDDLHRTYLLSLPTDTASHCAQAAARVGPALRAGIPSAPVELRYVLTRCGAEDPTVLMAELPRTPLDTLRALEPELRAWTEHPEREVRMQALFALFRLEQGEADGAGSGDTP